MGGKRELATRLTYLQNGAKGTVWGCPIDNAIVAKRLKVRVMNPLVDFDLFPPMFALLFPA